jgi:hypothetical protein
LWRPWPWAFIHANKRIENRSHEILYRGDVVFQAAKRFDAGAVDMIQRIERYTHPEDWEQRPICSGIKSLHPAGVLSFVGEIVDCVSRAEADKRAERGFVDDHIAWNAQMPWTIGPWCIVVVNIRPLAPIPWKGSQGWFDVPDAIVAEALRAA